MTRPPQGAATSVAALFAAAVAVAVLILPSLESPAPIDPTEKPWKTWRPGRVAEGGTPEKKPDDWFTRQRAYPHPDIPEVERRRGMAEAAALRVLQPRGAGTWEEAGPTNVQGRITSIDAVESTPTRIYIGTADGGVWRSDDAGANWTPVFDDQPSLAVGAVAVHPTNGDIVYAGTGEANAAGDTYSGDGIYRTEDGGATWAHLGLDATAKIADIEIDRTDPDRVFVAAMGRLFSTNPERGLYRTTDAGGSWELVLFENDSTGVASVEVHPTDSDIVFASTWERIRRPGYRTSGGPGSGVWRSTDGGDTFTRLGAAQGLPGVGPNVGRIGLAMARSNPDVVYAYYCDHPGYFIGVYKTTNGGDTWSRVNDGAIDDVTSSFGWYFGQIEVAPTDPNRVFVLGVPLYRSTTGGSSWSNVGSSMHVDHHAVWIDPGDVNRVYAGNDGGFYRSQNGGTNWIRGGGLPITQFYAITVDEQLPHRIFGGTQDNSTPGTFDGDPDSWDVLYYGDGFYTLVDPTDSNTIYAEYQYGGLGKSTNGGGSWNDATSGISGGDRRNWSTPVVMDPTDEDVLYYGTYRLYRSTNGASSWSPISGDLTDGDHPGSLIYGTITTIDVAPTDPTDLLVGTDDGKVWISRNTGGSWTEITGTLPLRWVTRVAFDPTDADVVLVTLSGFKIDGYQPHIFRSTNGGATWTDISSNLPDIPLNDVIVDPADPSRLYVGSDAGVFWTANLGGSWQLLGSGFPLVGVHDLQLHQGTRKLVAGTHGRSAWTFDLEQITVGVDAPSVAVAPRVSVAPNPMRASTTFEVAVDRAGPVAVTVYDVRGREVSGLTATATGAGALSLHWDGRAANGDQVAPGAYLTRTVAPGGGVAVGKVLVVE
jgi:photosystem II stability/assembly factor-like uncharacterized protein